MHSTAQSNGRSIHPTSYRKQQQKNKTKNSCCITVVRLRADCASGSILCVVVVGQFSFLDPSIHPFHPSIKISFRGEKKKKKDIFGFFLFLSLSHERTNTRVVLCSLSLSFFSAHGCRCRRWSPDRRRRRTGRFGNVVRQISGVGSRDVRITQTPTATHFFSS